MKLKLFFSWQSDDKEQTKILRKSLQKAINEVKRKTKLEYELDEATRNRPGSPDIKVVIMEKIEDASVFVADVTPFATASSRHHSNSNVMFELGYATAILGPSRIIQISMPPLDLLPFDIASNRTTILDKDTVEHLTNAIIAIQEHNPPTVYERRIAEPARHANMRANVEGYFSNIPSALLADSISRLPGGFDSRLASVFDDLSARRQRPDKSLPSDLQALYDDFHHAFYDLIELGANFPNTSGSLVRLPKSREHPDVEEVTRKAVQVKQRLQSSYEMFTAAARDRFPEIRFEQISHEAAKLYA